MYSHTRRSSTTPLNLSGSARAALLTICVINALAVPSLYCYQTLADGISDSFPNQGVLSLVPTLPLVGYGAGVGWTAFGPSTDERISTLFHLALLSASLVATGLAANLQALLISGFLAGFGAAIAQTLLAAAGRISGPTASGVQIGRVVFVTIAAVLAVRLLGDNLARLLGWQSMFLMSGLLVAAVGLFVAITNTLEPFFAQASTHRRSALVLWLSYPLLRQTALQQAFLFASFNACWAQALRGLLMPERSFVVAFGCSAGLIAALAAGGLAAKIPRSRIAAFGNFSVLLAVIFLLPAGYLAPHGFLRGVFLSIGMAMVDGGMQSALVANQTRVQGLEPATRVRLAAILTLWGFAGGAVGAGAGDWLSRAFGWRAVVLFSIGTGALGVSVQIYQWYLRCKWPLAASRFKALLQKWRSRSNSRTAIHIRGRGQQLERRRSIWFGRPVYDREH